VTTALATRPQYDQFRDLARGFAQQILATCGPYLPRPAADLRVLDIGCGYGHTARELAGWCRRVVGIEPSTPLWQAACDLSRQAGLKNLEFRHHGVDQLSDDERYDLVVLDNVLEHLPDQPRALSAICDCLAPGGVLFILVPNRLWPIEVHYGLPLLSYLPLPLANAYLRLCGRGRDYTDASYMPTYWGLNRLLRQQPELTFDYVLPADLSLTTAGPRWHYRLGAAAIRRFPCLWAISKALLVVARKRK
jgi:2-polyprenyl-3-methyl-5-hydroxy-6-metoxy-1,4-benzoquinol methylase